MGHLEFEGFDKKTTKALQRKVANVTESATMTQAVVKAFLANVEWNGQDIREQVHDCTVEELADQLSVMSNSGNLGVSRKKCVFLARRLREIVRLPE